MIIARGWKWTVSKADVAGFFADIEIIGGIDSIELRKYHAMEAIFTVRSRDMRKALARNKLSIGSRMIFGMQDILFWLQ